MLIVWGSGAVQAPHLRTEGSEQPNFRDFRGKGLSLSITFYLHDARDYTFERRIPSRLTSHGRPVVQQSLNVSHTVWLPHAVIYHF